MTWLQDLKQHREAIIDQCYGLRMIANAFSVTGNAHVEVQLNDIADIVQNHIEAINKVISDKLDSDLGRQREDTGRTLSVCLDKVEEKES